MLQVNSTLRLTVGLSLLLLVAITATGFVSSSYRREKQVLGQNHYHAGLALENQGKLDEAVEEFRKALIFSPDNAEYRTSFASALLKAGRLDEAQSHIDQLLQEDPTNGVLNLMLGRIAKRQGEISKAIEYYQRAVYEYWPPQRANERREARLELIDMLASSGRREELIGELMTMYANAPTDQALRAKIGFSLLDHGATSEAMQVFRELIRILPKSAEAHRGLAQSYFASGDYVSARHEFERALRLDSKDGISANELKLTNAVIDLDPDLIGIREKERRRRAQNLLRRVVTDVQRCADPATAAEALKQANALLAASNKSDVALEMQESAIELWKRRPQLCAGKPTSDGALATVLARLEADRTGADRSGGE